jgi:hypothetical protein
MTQHEKLIVSMAKDNTGRWFYPYDFMGGNTTDLFVGYEASARLSELAKLYPLMIETKTDGKYKVRRIDFTKMYQWQDSVPKDVKRLIDEYHTPPKAVSWLND